MLTFQTIRETTKNLPIPQSLLGKISRAATKTFHLKKKYRINIILTTSAKSRALNRRWRKKDYVADVLTFSYEDSLTPLADGSYYLGELILVPDVIALQAKSLGHDWVTEFTILVIHGIVHMMGYEHEGVSPQKKQAMIRKENALLSDLKLRRFSSSKTKLHE